MKHCFIDYLSIYLKENEDILLSIELWFYFFKGGAGGRVINIGSMAGLVPGVTGFDGLGYPVSKWGTVAFTRYKK